MVDVIKEAEAAERMMSDIASRQEQKAQKHAEEAREVARAEAHAAEVAAGVAAGKVADAHVGEPATSEPAFDPTQEARAAERMVASLEADKEAKAARHAQEVEELDNQVLDEVKAASHVTDSIKSTMEHLKEKFAR